MVPHWQWRQYWSNLDFNCFGDLFCIGFRISSSRPPHFSLSREMKMNDIYCTSWTTGTKGRYGFNKKFNPFPPNCELMLHSKVYSTDKTNKILIINKKNIHVVCQSWFTWVCSSSWHLNLAFNEYIQRRQKTIRRMEVVWH